jgi:hypothetical protein
VTIGCGAAAASRGDTDSSVGESGPADCGEGGPAEPGDDEPGEGGDDGAVGEPGDEDPGDRGGESDGPADWAGPRSDSVPREAAGPPGADDEACGSCMSIGGTSQDTCTDTAEDIPGGSTGNKEMS